jgi:hypothetical protein
MSLFIKSFLLLPIACDGEVATQAVRLAGDGGASSLAARPSVIEAPKTSFSWRDATSPFLRNREEKDQ